MKPTLALLALLGLAACGADGEPIQPTAGLNVGVGSSGVTAGASVGLRKGPFGIYWGLG